MVAMFAEDIGLLPRYFFQHLVEECREPADSYDKLGGLFEAMNAPASPTGGRYKGVRYFNGGVFAHPARLELQADELAQLRGTDGGLFGAVHIHWRSIAVWHVTQGEDHTMSHADCLPNSGATI